MLSVNHASSNCPQENKTLTKKDNKASILRVARGNGLFHLFSKCACVHAIYKYHVEQNRTLIMALTEL